jgi:hypothetical protein
MPLYVINITYRLTNYKNIYLLLLTTINFGGLLHPARESVVVFAPVDINFNIFITFFLVEKVTQDIFEEEALGGEVKGVLVGGVLNVLVLLVVVVAGVVVPRKGLVGRILSEGASILLELSYEKLR